MITDYASVGGQELWNTLRLQDYLTNVGSPFTSGTALCGCDTLTAAMLGQDTPYQTPVLDPAPWYDPDHVVTNDFLGFMPLSVTGLGDNPRARNVTGAVGGGGVFGPSRELPRTITVTGLLIGATCCGAEFGMHYLAEVLAGCCGDSCDGDSFEMFNCCPSATMTRAQFLATSRRTFRRTALVSGPTETGRVGTGGGCARGTCGVAGDIIQVEFVLVAGAPWPWTDPTELLSVGLPIGGSGDCVDWCVTVGDPVTDPVCGLGEDCLHASCSITVDTCVDPLNPIPAPPVPSQPDAGFCIPLAPERACYTLDLSTRPAWASDVPIITIAAGSTALRNVRITLYERPDTTPLTCDQIAEADRCDPADDFYITFIPANGAITIDGQTGRALLECGGECRSASTVYGDQDGGPLSVRDLTCARYCLCIETDPLFPPAADANLTLSISGKGY